MEIRLSLGLLVLLCGVALGLSSRAPRAALAPASASARELAELEDTFATARSDLPLARKLAAAYLQLEEPALAIGVVRAVTPELTTDPILTHRLAVAYEAVGRLDDAAATSAVALSRCRRAVGSSQAALSATPATFSCSPGALVAMEQHAQALSQMLRWGVNDPTRDPRARVARGMAERRARIASLDTAPDATISF